jgi:hypothetical protein
MTARDGWLRAASPWCVDCARDFASTPVSVRLRAPDARGRRGAHSHGDRSIRRSMPRAWFDALVRNWRRWILALFREVARALQASRRAAVIDALSALLQHACEHAICATPRDSPLALLKVTGADAFVGFLSG